jgi:hypothetical protein
LHWLHFSISPLPQDPTILRYGCGVATTAQVNKVSSDLAALEPKVSAAAAQASSAQATRGNQTVALRTEVDALREAVAALTAQLQELRANVSNAANPAVVAQQFAALAASDTRTAQQIAALNTTLAAVDLSPYAKTADLASLNAVTLGGVPAAQYVRSRVVLFRESDTLRNGNLGGRSGADALCSASVLRPAGLVRVRAFLSVSSTDQISAFPALYKVPTGLPVESTSGAVLASNFTTLLGGSIQQTLVQAGVFTTATTWWSGSNVFDDFITPGCGGFTSSSNAVVGCIGLTSSTILN